LQTHELVLVFGGVNYNPQMEKRTSSIKTGGRTTHETLGNINLKLFPKTYELKYPTSLLNFPRLPGSAIHPTQKPVALFEYLIKTYTQKGDTVLDPCVGSGTTAIAARNTGRHFICGDSSQEYVDMANMRLQGRVQEHKAKQEGKPFTQFMFSED
jgi:DNA modification methylase